MTDVLELKEKPAILEDAHSQVATVTKQFRRGLITDSGTLSTCNRNLDKSQGYYSRQVD